LSNRVEPEIPNITLDHDQVKSARTNTTSAKKTAKPTSTNNSAKTSSSLATSLLLFVSYTAIAGGSWYFYQQQIQLNKALNNSDQRIQQLENQLSATGEEMGESTIALKAKLEAVSAKTELLLTEMDKLWASAWRKNQKEIKELSSQSKKIATQQSKNTNAVKAQGTATNELNDKITATEFSIDAVSEQIVAANEIKDQISKLASQFNTLDANSKSRDKQQMITATSINEFDTSLQLMLERIERVEARVAAGVAKSQKKTAAVIKP
jgi:chromosome segregation ATPase